MKPKSLPSHPIPNQNFFLSNNMDPKQTFLFFGDENKMQNCPNFKSLHKKHFSEFGFSFNIQRFNFWRIIKKNKIKNIVFNESSVKYRDFILYIMKGKPEKIAIFFIFLPV
jgi:hypothetical protein